MNKATTLAVLLEAKNRNNAEKFLSDAVEHGYIPADAMEAVLESYKMQRLAQLLPSLFFIVTCTAGLLLVDSHPSTGLVMMLVGAVGMIAWIISSGIAFKNSLWNRYYSWYQRASNMRGLKKVLGLTEEEDFGEIEETEEETDRRVRQQMKDAGYTDEQIDKAFSE